MRDVVVALALRTRSPIFVEDGLVRDDDTLQEMGGDKSMEELQRKLEDMDPEEFGKLWS